VQADLKGKTLVHVSRPVHELKLEELRVALGTETADQTATLVPFFGPTVDGEEGFVDALGLDFSRALLGGVAYEWARAFEPNEVVDVSVVVEDQYEKSGMEFAVVTSEFRDGKGELIQRQRATFIEREAS